MDKKAAGKLANALTGRMMGLTLYHGVLILALPFILFVVFAIDDIRPEAAAICAAICAAVLWLCTWDFVRLAVKRKTEPFCSVWMKVLPQDVPAKPDGDERQRTPSFLVTANGLFLIRLIAVAIATLALGVAAFFLQSDLLMIFTPIVWYWIERRNLGRLLQSKADIDSALAAETERHAALLKNPPKRSYRERFPQFAHAAKDFALWTWVIAPLWAYMVMLAPGALPRAMPAEVGAFFDVKIHEPKDDGFYALAGLNAPPDVTDIVSFGKEKVARLRAAGETFEAGLKDKDLLPELATYDHFNICTRKKLPSAVPLDNPLFANPYAPPPDPALVGPPLPPPPVPENPCLYLEEWGKIIAANRRMLDRYENLYRYQDFETPVDVWDAVPGTLLMQLSRLQAVALAYRAYRQGNEPALQDWLENARFVRRLIEGPSPALAFSVRLTCQVIAHRYLPYVLGRAPDLARKYRKDIFDTIIFLHPGAFDYKVIWDTDMRWMMALMSGKFKSVLAYVPALLLPQAEFMLSMLTDKDSVKLRLFAATRDVHAALDIRDVAAREKEIERLQEADSFDGKLFYRLDDMTAIYQSAMVNLLMSGMIKVLPLFDGDGFYTNKRRATAAYVNAVAEGGDDVFAYLKRAAATDPVMTNVRDGTPFYWDAAKRGVCFAYKTKWSNEPWCYEAPNIVEREDQLKE
ncbi:MAG: hypothetical protein ACAH83_01680 [Alphaproteobacteria bacterium]